MIEVGSVLTSLPMQDLPILGQGAHLISSPVVGKALTGGLPVGSLPTVRNVLSGVPLSSRPVVAQLLAARPV
jgi:hypothetical protein